ncbi:MAG: hypothetical protein LRY73_01040 [Bacillus sp. (in: Bacteria)]|nr:hypothetical protein [Bacillus sp. (in: firmicutes)]
MFLGRSFVTMEGMIRNLIPGDDELLEFVKPVFMEWLERQGNNKWSFVWNWLQSMPGFKVIHSAVEFLKLPEKLEDMKEHEQRRQFQFVIYENYKKHFYQLVILGLVGVVVGIYLEHELVLWITSGAGVVGGVGFLIFAYKQKKWMKYMHEKRR